MHMTSYNISSGNSVKIVFEWFRHLVFRSTCLKEGTTAMLTQECQRLEYNYKEPDLHKRRGDRKKSTNSGNNLHDPYVELRAGDEEQQR